MSNMSSPFVTSACQRPIMGQIRSYSTIASARRRATSMEPAPDFVDHLRQSADASGNRRNACIERLGDTAVFREAREWRIEIRPRLSDHRRRNVAGMNSAMSGLEGLSSKPVFIPRGPAPRTAGQHGHIRTLPTTLRGLDHVP